MINPKEISLNTATVKTKCNLRECAEKCSEFGIGGISPWRDKIKEFGLKESVKIINDNGLKVSGLCRGGMFTNDIKLTDKILDENKKAVDEAKTLNAKCLIIVAGGLKSNSKNLIDSYKQIEEGLSLLLEYSKKVKLPLALEPLHPMYASDRSCINTLKQALDICDQLGEGIGVAVDVYHLWWDIDIENQIKRAGKDRLLAFHLCDWLRETNDLLLDRGMMGDGIINLSKIKSFMTNSGYKGQYEVEIFSKNNWWKKEADEVINVIIERLKKL